jgi:hypothetical protein
MFFYHSMKSAEKTDSKAHPEVGTTCDAESSGDGMCATTCNTEKGSRSKRLCKQQNKRQPSEVQALTLHLNPNPKDVDCIFYRNSKTFWGPNTNRKDVDCIFYWNFDQ